MSAVVRITWSFTSVSGVLKSLLRPTRAKTNEVECKLNFCWKLSNRCKSFVARRRQTWTKNVSYQLQFNRFSARTFFSPLPLSELLLMYGKDGANDILNCHQSCWGTWYWRRSWIFVRFFIKSPPRRNCSAELSEDKKKSNTVWWRKLFARQINKEISKCHLQNLNDTFVLEHNKSKYFFPASRERARPEKIQPVTKATNAN